jgi:hypothetical protein
MNNELERKWKEAVMAVLNVKFLHLPQKKREAHNSISLLKYVQQTFM